MKNAILGAVVALALMGLGLFWWGGRAEVERAAPPPESITADNKADDIPIATDPSLRGPPPPEATKLSREQRRFFRFDQDRDGQISRREMLSTRTAAFRKLDKNGNNLLDFEEWAVATVERFDGADSNGDGVLTADEFRSTAPKERARPACRC